MAFVVYGINSMQTALKLLKGKPDFFATSEGSHNV